MNFGVEPLPNGDLACEEVRDLLHALISNELEKDEVKPVLDHLAKCEACRAALAEHTNLAGKMAHHMPSFGKKYFSAVWRQYN